MAVSTVANAKALLKSAIRSDNPIIFFEHVLLYNVKGAPPLGAAAAGGSCCCLSCCCLLGAVACCRLGWGWGGGLLQPWGAGGQSWGAVRRL